MATTSFSRSTAACAHRPLVSGGRKAIGYGHSTHLRVVEQDFPVPDGFADHIPVRHAHFSVATGRLGGGRSGPLLLTGRPARTRCRAGRAAAGLVDLHVREVALSVG